MHAHWENGARAPGFEAGRGKTGYQKADVRARTGLPEPVPRYACIPSKRTLIYHPCKFAKFGASNQLGASTPVLALQCGALL